MAPDKLLQETLTRSVIGAFYEVYNHLGYGFLESLYVSALERELLAREHDVMREFCVRIMGLLLHFGPRPTFHRVICKHSKYNPEHPFHPEDPYNPSS